MKFKAPKIFAGYNDNEVLVIGFFTDSNNTDGPTYFLIQDSQTYDEQDKQLGSDTYYIEKNDQSMGGYGGVTELRLERNKIQIELNDQGVENLKEKRIEIEFECNDEEFENLLNRLEHVFSKGELYCSTKG